MSESDVDPKSPTDDPSKLIWSETDMKDARWFSFDLESTNFIGPTGVPIQITIMNNYEKVVLYSYIYTDIESSPGAYNVHHIPTKFVQPAPTFAQLHPLIQKVFDQDKVVDGYNIKRFDVPMLQHAAKFYGLPKFRINMAKITCCMQDYTKARSLPKSIKLVEATEAEGLPEFKAHDALEDTLAAVRLRRRITNIEREKEKFIEEVCVTLMTLTIPRIRDSCSWTWPLDPGGSAMREESWSRMIMGIVEEFCAGAPPPKSRKKKK